jgi:hypothetical protein
VTVAKIGCKHNRSRYEILVGRFHFHIQEYVMNTNYNTDVRRLIAVGRRLRISVGTKMYVRECFSLRITLRHNAGQHRRDVFPMPCHHSIGGGKKRRVRTAASSGSLLMIDPACRRRRPSSFPRPTELLPYQVDWFLNRSPGIIIGSSLF